MAFMFTFKLCLKNQFDFGASGESKGGLALAPFWLLSPARQPCFRMTLELMISSKAKAKHRKQSPTNRREIDKAHKAF